MSQGQGKENTWLGYGSHSCIHLKCKVVKGCITNWVSGHNGGEVEKTFSCRNGVSMCLCSPWIWVTSEPKISFWLLSDYQYHSKLSKIHFLVVHCLGPSKCAKGWKKLIWLNIYSDLCFKFLVVFKSTNSFFQMNYWFFKRCYFLDSESADLYRKGYWKMKVL